MQALYVAAGGACGATCRFLLSMLPLTDRGLPLPTFLANVIGCFLMGIIAAKGEARGWDANLLLFLKTGFCGGLTTFSTFSAETMAMAEKVTRLPPQSMSPPPWRRASWPSISAANW